MWLVHPSWLVTDCCAVLMCKEYVDRWLELDSTCPHCRDAVTVDSCSQIGEIRSIGEIIATWVVPDN